MTAYEIRFEMIMKAGEFLWNKVSYDKNKWKFGNQDKHIPDHNSYTQPTKTENIFKLAHSYSRFV